MLQLTDVFLDNAYKIGDIDVALVLCQHAEGALTQARGTTKKVSRTEPEDQALRERIATAYFDLGKLLDSQDLQAEAQAFYKKSEKWG